MAPPHSEEVHAPAERATTAPMAIPGGAGSVRVSLDAPAAMEPFPPGPSFALVDGAAPVAAGGFAPQPFGFIAGPREMRSATLADARPMHGRWSHAIGPMRREVKSMQVSNTTELAEMFRAHDYTLDGARRGGAVPSLHIEKVPADLGALKDGNERKALFIKALLPIVLEANERILADREELLRLRAVDAAGGAFDLAERMWLAELADRYNLEPTQLDELITRVDAVPPSMAIAQAGVESGWGTSYAARVGNALFGQIQPTGRHAVQVPWRPGPAMPQPFASVVESCEAYFLNLNTHPAYAAFRVERAMARGAGKSPDGYRLIGNLMRYSELGQGYINFVRGIMRENKLSDFDEARLSPI
ncbi:MAG: glucosaminidase domain-containing protein [Rhodospirillales bacterium]|nr:glucosaminidase domain-containing protein [Rhodospirillales bacterium]